MALSSNFTSAIALVVRKAGPERRRIGHVRARRDQRQQGQTRSNGVPALGGKAADPCHHLVQICRSCSREQSGDDQKVGR